MQNLLIKSSCFFVAMIFCIVFPLATDAAGYPALTSLATRVLIYGIAAASLNLVLGYGGMVSFGHAAFFGLGGYVVGILYQHYVEREYFLGVVPGTNQFLVMLLLSIVVCGLAAAMIGALSLRTDGVQFIMITLAFAQMLFFLFVSLKTYGGDDGLVIRKPNQLFGFSLRDSKTIYYVYLAVTAVFFFLMWRIVNSRFGNVLIGIRQNERRMAALGLPTYRYKLAAFVLSGIGTGIAGCMMANFLRFTGPDLMHWMTSGELLIMVLLGGVGTLFGPLLGAGAYVILEATLTSWTEYWQLGLGAILLFVVLRSHGGIHALVVRIGGRAA